MSQEQHLLLPYQGPYDWPAMLGQRPNARQLLARAEAWRPWRAYAAQHLWTVSG